MSLVWQSVASPFRGNPLSPLRETQSMCGLYLTRQVSQPCERGDLPAFLFRLRGTRKRNQGIDQCLHWSMKATYVAFGHDSSLHSLAYGRCFDSIESRLHHIGPPHLRQKSLYQSFRFCQGLFAISHLIKRGIAFHGPPSPL